MLVIFRALKKGCILFLILLFMMLVAGVEACYTVQEAAYYSKKSNFITATGNVSYIKYNEDKNRLYMAFPEDNETLKWITYHIADENLRIVQERGIDEKMKLGDSVTIGYGPRVFGDGYSIPVVQISVNGEELLSFEEGYPNLMKKYGIITD